MNGKIILTLFILFYHKEQVKSKKINKNDELFMNEDLIFYENEPHYKVKRQLEIGLEVGSGLTEEPTTLFYNSTFFTLTTEQTTIVINPCVPNPCPGDEVCTVKGNSYECNCEDGLVFNVQQLSCQDIDECALNISRCGPNEYCKNKIKGYNCLCIDGYERINGNGTCVEIPTTESPLTSPQDETTFETSTTRAPEPIVDTTDTTRPTEPETSAVTFETTSSTTSAPLTTESDTTETTLVSNVTESETTGSETSTSSSSITDNTEQTTEAVTTVTISSTTTSSTTEAETTESDATGSTITDNTVQTTEAVTTITNSSTTPSSTTEAETTESASSTTILTTDKETTSSETTGSETTVITDTSTTSTTTIDDQSTISLSTIVTSSETTEQETSVTVSTTTRPSTITDVETSTSTTPEVTRSSTTTTTKISETTGQESTLATSERSITEVETTVSTSTQSTSTTQIPSSSTTISSTTTVPVLSLIQGFNDKSIKNDVLNAVFTHLTNLEDLKILGVDFDMFRVHSNGFISLDSKLNVRKIEDPTYTIKNFDFPIIAPLWANSYLDSDSDVLFGAYTKSNLDPNIIDGLRTKGYTNENDLVYSITWKNVRQNGTDKRASFQLFLTISFDQQRANAIFNYAQVDFENKGNIFIGYTDGKNLEVTNKNAKNTDASGVPNLVTLQKGNTNSNGFYVYDLPFERLDQCSIWYNKLYASNAVPLSVQNKDYVSCPLTDKYMNSYFIIYKGYKWQNGNCYQLKSNSFTVIQQFCCYDRQTNELITTGLNSGFFYNTSSLENVIQIGKECCKTNKWEKCSRFYKFYPHTQVTEKKFEVTKCWGGGDPHLTTFDGFTYSFNGLGKFVLTRASDKSFEVQALTSALLNLNESASLTGTLFTNFVMKTSRSKIFQIDLIDAEKTNPYFNLTIDKFDTDSSFIRNFDYSKEFPCANDPSSICTTVIQTPNGVQFFFDNGMSIELAISTVSINLVQSRSWIVSSISFLNIGYTNTLEGLMGNNNGDSSDDLLSRTKQAPSNTTDRAYYLVAMSWLVTNEEDLFKSGTESRVIGLNNDPNRLQNYVPTFFDELPQNDLAILQCDNRKTCIYDSVISGLQSVGNQTLMDLNDFETTKRQLSLTPPLIVFRQNSVQFNWHNTIDEITITADVYDTNGFEVEFILTNVTVKQSQITGSLNKSVTIKFIPKTDHVPIIGLKAKDDTNLSSTIYFNNILICNCNPLSNESKCLYEVRDRVLSTTATMVGCQCNKFHEGKYCEKVKEECLWGKMCNKFGDFNFNCKSLNLTEQSLLDMGYTCEGDCPSGYTKDKYSACIDIEECKTPGICPVNSVCIEKFGSYECDCKPGYRLNKTSNLCDVIDLCKTSLNTCDQICTSFVNSLSCSCYPGYKLENDKCVQDTVVPGCNNQCDRICTLIGGAVTCACPIGYKLNSTGITANCEDVKECDVNNGECPDKCNEKVGSFECTCSEGFLFDPNTQKCRKCTNDTFGLNCSRKCNCGPNSVRCDPVSGCVCNPGYTGENCSIENACQNFPNSTVQSCITRGGLPILDCIAGYVLVNTTCERVNACDPNPCPLSASCLEQFPNFTCTCQSGFNYNPDKKVCENINECLNSNRCPENSDCYDSNGSFNCLCKNGYKNTNNDLKLPSCTDINECELNVCKISEICNNLNGTYECAPGTTTRSSTLSRTTEPTSSAVTSESTIAETTVSNPTTISDSTNTVFEITGTQSTYTASTEPQTSTSSLPITISINDSTTSSSTPISFTTTSTSTSESVSSTLTTTGTSVSSKTTSESVSSTSTTTGTSVSSTTTSESVSSTSTTTGTSVSSTTKSESVSSTTTSESVSSTSTTTGTSVSSTSTTTTTTSTVTTSQTTLSTTTPFMNPLIIGNKDESIKSRFDLNSYNSFRYSTRGVELNILGDSLNSFRVHPNGFITFTKEKNVNRLIDPTFSIQNFNFPIIAPLWASSVFDDKSDIVFGVYTSRTMDNKLLNELKDIMRNKAVSRGVALSEYEPELIYSISWKDIRESPTSDKRATFQLFLTVSNAQKTAYAIFNYVKVDWTEFNRNIFIGLTDGKLRQETNKYSVNSDASGTPNLIVSQPGNTGKLGRYFYDLSYTEPDECTNWFNQFVLQDVELPTSRLNFFITCPLIDSGMAYNPYYRLHNGRQWQNSKCYRLRTNAFFGDVVQQFCCYDKESRELIIQGKDSGFAYDSLKLEEIISTGSLCCNGRTISWESCQKFYRFYPSTLLSQRQLFILFGWGGGDPHLKTFDGFSYTFNGLGKYVYSRSKDKNSQNYFEIQAFTSKLVNLNTSTVLGTLFTSFVARTNRSSIFQIDLLDADKAKPYMILSVDKMNNTHSDFVRNFSYYREFSCKDSVIDVCTTIIQTGDSVQFLFDNGLSLSFTIEIISINPVETRSWIVCSTSFIETGKYNYRDKLEGLMGNWNGNIQDDVIGRNGEKPMNTRQQDYYFVAESWKVLNQEDLFAASTTSRTVGRIRGLPRQDGSFKPVFIEDMNIDPEIRQACNESFECVYDAIASGSVNIGKRTSLGIIQVQTATKQVNLSPPNIFRDQKELRINRNDQSTELSVTFSTFDTNNYNVEVDVRDVNTYRIENTTTSPFNRSYTIIFTPKKDKIPIVGVRAIDEDNLGSRMYLLNMLICDCQTLSKENECDYDVIQGPLGESANQVACRCSNYYEGLNCERVKNECLWGNKCNKLANFSLICEPLSVDDQKSTGRGYKCNGNCPNGYVKDIDGDCIDQKECNIAGSCPADSKECVEQIGSFDCICNEGFRYIRANRTCQKIDYCLTSANNCEQKCDSTLTGVQCSCFSGFSLDSATKKCVNDSSTIIPGCASLDCTEFCRNSDAGTPECSCRPGYRLASDRKNCQDIPECTEIPGICPDKCVEKIGSFECVCNNGTYFDANSQKCAQCPSLTYGFNCSETCKMGVNTIRCDPVSGPICNFGYTGLDCNTTIDACKGKEISNSTCYTRNGLPVYECIAGYRFVNGSCVLINNCESNPCNSNSSCTSYIGNYTCTSPSGFVYNYLTNEFDDIAECKIVICPVNSVCVEQPGTYKCDCESGYENINGTSKVPKCVDVDECALNLSGCPQTQICFNLPGSNDCKCPLGFIEDTNNNSNCIPIPTSFTTPQNTLPVGAKTFTKDNTGLILVIVLPIIAVLILSVLAGSICICWYRMRSQKSMTKQTKLDTNRTTDHNGMGGIQPEQSMFQKKDTDSDLIKFDDDSVGGLERENRDMFDDDSPTTSHSAYRTSYLFDQKIGTNDDIFKTLEDNVRTTQKKTIGRPQSVFTGSSFSLPTAYHEQTTPYGDFIGDKSKQYRIDNNQVLNENDINYDLDDDDTFDAFDNDDDLDDIIEAFNPNVKIPRPKIQINPLKIFKFGPKNSESEN